MLSAATRRFRQLRAERLEEKNLWGSVATHEDRDTVYMQEEDNDDSKEAKEEHKVSSFSSLSILHYLHFLFYEKNNRAVHPLLLYSMVHLAYTRYPHMGPLCLCTHGLSCGAVNNG